MREEWWSFCDALAHGKRVLIRCSDGKERPVDEVLVDGERAILRCGAYRIVIESEEFEDGKMPEWRAA